MSELPRTAVLWTRFNQTPSFEQNASLPCPAAGLDARLLAIDLDVLVNLS